MYILEYFCPREKIDGIQNYFGFHVDNKDKALSKALSAGAVVEEEVYDCAELAMKSAGVRCPFGILWHMYCPKPTGCFKAYDG